MPENQSLASAEQTVSQLVQDQRDDYAAEEEVLRGEGYEASGDSRREDARFDDIDTHIESAQEMSDLWEAEQQSLGVADDSAEFMASRRDL